MRGEEWKVGGEASGESCGSLNGGIVINDTY